MQSYSRRRFSLLASAGLALLAGCGNQQGSGQAAAVPGPAPESTSLAFFDSDAFDSSLASALSAGPKNVRVTFAGTTSVNNMPPRINAWLTAVQKSDGTVVAKDPADPTGSRGLLGLGMIADLIDLVTWYRERSERQAELATVSNYNAAVLFNTHTGELRELVFEHK